MGKPGALKRYASPERAILPALPEGLTRGRPRSFAEWKALRGWGKLPAWEVEPVGYLLRLGRQNAGLTQAALAKRLGCTQQAIAQAERWESNPTIDFVRRWAGACGAEVKIGLR